MASTIYIEYQKGLTTLQKPKSFQQAVTEGQCDFYLSYGIINFYIHVKSLIPNVFYNLTCNNFLNETYVFKSKGLLQYIGCLQISPKYIIGRKRHRPHNLI